MPAEEKIDLLSLLPAELDELIAAIGWKRYRSSQIFARLHRRGVSSVEEIRELPSDMRTLLAEKTFLSMPSVAGRSLSADGLTEKYLLRLHDALAVESVLMHYPNRESVCISSQVGCRLGCGFCATGRAGFKRNLSSGEMVGEVYALSLASGLRMDNVLFMGMGEPFDNYDAVIKAIRLLTSAAGLNIGQRHITVSTCGLVPGIMRFASEQLQVRLAISLHGATDAVRSGIMPINRVYPLHALMSACRDYQRQTGRRLTFEYTVIPGTNDGREQARALAVLLRDINALVNVIPFNPATVGAEPLCREAAAFAAMLTDLGVRNTLRSGRGSSLSAGCGQLAAHNERK